MPTYMCIRRSHTEQPHAAQPLSPAQMQEMYALFTAWKETFQQHIVDLGGRLNDGGKVLTAERVIDGPFVEAKEVIGGYMILSAIDLDHALEVARQCPGVVAPHASLEIREIFTI